MRSLNSPCPNSVVSLILSSQLPDAPPFSFPSYSLSLRERVGVRASSITSCVPTSSSFVIRHSFVIPSFVIRHSPKPSPKHCQPPAKHSPQRPIAQSQLLPNPLL